jgi:anhydro-N-acetylmuramic acid kinase
MSKIEIIGLMSGTSMDGLDIAHVEFEKSLDQKYSYRVLNTKQVDFPDSLKEELQSATHYPVQQILILDKKLGRFYADSVNQFIIDNKLKRTNISAIASHGQTIFHQPQHGYTFQIGCGSTLAFETGIKVINDFRTKDVIAGGQGAPLVPIGDFELFSNDIESFLNIGGFVNISFKDKGIIKAFDVCPGNLPLNKLVNVKGLEYDNNGEIARSGDINFFLLDLLNSLPYYAEEGPKSLGTEWLEEFFYPLLKFDKEIENNLRTVVEHIAIQTSSVLNKQEIKSVFITGGGAQNKFLIDRISNYFNGDVVIPDLQIINFKEAIIFAFLGVLYLNGEANNLPSVTGASRPVIGGVLHVPN